MRNFLIILKSVIVLMLLSSNSFSVVSAPAPASPSVLSQISSSMSHSVVNSNNITNNSNSLTSTVISSTELKEEIKETAAALGLEVDESATDILSGLSLDEDGENKEEIVKAMEEANDNIRELGHDYEMTVDENTMMYDSGWVTLTKVTTGSNGLTYSSDKNVFQDGAVQQARGKVYVNFKKGEMSGDMFTKITLKGESQISHSWNTGTAGITSVPIVASTVRGLKSDGTTDFDEFVDINPSMKAAADTLAPQYEVGKTKQELMDWYNHDTNNADADKRVFFYGKFVTIDPTGSEGTGTIIIEGAHDNEANATGPVDMFTGKDGEERYLDTVERHEGASTLVGRALE